MNFGLVRSPDELHHLIRVCSDGAELTLWRRAQLSVRGVLTASLIEKAQASIPKRSECLCVYTNSGSGVDPRPEGESWHDVSEMLAELKERIGESVAIGAWPTESDRIVAVKGGVEGPR